MLALVVLMRCIKKLKKQGQAYNTKIKIWLTLENFKELYKKSGESTDTSESCIWISWFYTRETKRTIPNRFNNA